MRNVSIQLNRALCDGHRVRFLQCVHMVTRTFSCNRNVLPLLMRKAADNWFVEVACAEKRSQLVTTPAQQNLRQMPESPRLSIVHQQQSLQISLRSLTRSLSRAATGKLRCQVMHTDQTKRRQRSITPAASSRRRTGRHKRIYGRCWKKSQFAPTSPGASRGRSPRERS